MLAVFHGQDKKNQIVLVAVKDGSVRVLKAFDQQAPQRACFSPDGRFVAYDFPQGTPQGEHDIFLLAVDGGRETPLVQHPANDVVFDWTPDGKRILFGSDRSGTMSAWLIRVADGKPQGTPEMVKPDLGQNVTPMGFTQDGSYYYRARTGMTRCVRRRARPATGRQLVDAERRHAALRGLQHESRLVVRRTAAPSSFHSAARGMGSQGDLRPRHRERRGARAPVEARADGLGLRWSPTAGPCLRSHSIRRGGSSPFCASTSRPATSSAWTSERAGLGTAWSRDGKAIFYHQVERHHQGDLDRGAGPRHRPGEGALQPWRALPLPRRSGPVP